MGLLADMHRSSLQRVAVARERVPEAALRAAVLGTPAPPPLLRLAPSGFDLIAELKLRSPSLGDLSAATLDPVRRLEAYAEGGAAICSILTEPDRFDVGRNPNPHMAFGGGGPHLCLGMHVARIELQSMLREIVTRLPDIEPAGKVVPMASNFIAGIHSMPVTFSA